jgi:hypothetical protein
MKKINRDGQDMQDKEISNLKILILHILSIPVNYSLRRWSDASDGDGLVRRLSG